MNTCGHGRTIGDCEICDTKEELRIAKRELTASQAREAELRERLEAAEAMNSLQAQSIGVLSKELEAAEDRIVELEAQLKK